LSNSLEKFAMKKTLIALAALASVSAFAQSSVTLSGKLGVGFQKAQAGIGGMSVTDGDLKVTAVEDLGGGLKATAAAEFLNRGRQTATSGRDATIALSGGFGSVTVGNIEAGNGIIGRGFAGAPVSLATGYDGAILDGALNADYFNYTAPAMNGVSVGVSRLDSIGSAVGSSAGKGDLQANVLAVNYAAGPLSAGVDTTKFYGSTTVSRTRASASYDLGVATVGFGYSKKQGTDRQTAMGVKVPMGAVTLGAIYAKNGTAKGYGVGMDYAFSKSTVLNVSYGDETSDANGTQYRVRLLKSF
jgi:Gram-negative porin